MKTYPFIIIFLFLYTELTGQVCILELYKDHEVVAQVKNGKVHILEKPIKVAYWGSSDLPKDSQVDIPKDPKGWKVISNDKWKFGFANEKGEVVIPLIYENAKEFSENDLAGVLLDNKWGFIDRTGKTVIPHQFEDYLQFDIYGSSYDAVYFQPYLYRFFGDIAWVHVEKDGDYWGAIDKNGNFVIEPVFETIEFGCNVVAVEKQDNSSPERKTLWGVYTLDGKPLTAIEYDKAIWIIKP